MDLCKRFLHLTSDARYGILPQIGLMAGAKMATRQQRRAYTRRLKKLQQTLAYAEVRLQKDDVWWHLMERCRHEKRALETLATTLFDEPASNMEES